MNTLARYLSREIASAIVLFLAALVFLFVFFDFIGELGETRGTGYTATHALLFVFLNIPARIQELLPIAALIGALFSLARLAGNSEFTVIRAAGVSAYRLVGYLGALGLGLAILTFAVGEFVTPVSEKLAQQLKIRATSRVVAQEFKSGLWAKDGGHFINIRDLLADGRLSDIRIYEFDDQYRLRSLLQARTGSWMESGFWRLESVTTTRLAGGHVEVKTQADMPWSSALTPNLISALIVNPERMTLRALSTYIAYLDANRQKSDRYQLAYWHKFTFPLAAAVMLMLALPFGYQPPRAHGPSSRVLLGILLGLGFHMLNRLFGNVGLLNDWPPALGACLPLALVCVTAIGSLWYVERR